MTDYTRLKAFLAGEDDLALVYGADAASAIQTLVARVKVLEDALRVAQAHVANNAQGWSVGRGASRDDLAIVDAALADSQPAEPVTNAGCCQPVRVKPQEPAPMTPAQALKVQALVDAGERMTGPLWRLILADENCIKNPCDLPTCECRQKFDRIAGPWFAAIAAWKDAPK